MGVGALSLMVVIRTYIANAVASYISLSVISLLKTIGAHCSLRDKKSFEFTCPMFNMTSIHSDFVRLISYVATVHDFTNGLN